jgi:hypothetical protein
MGTAILATIIFDVGLIGVFAIYLTGVSAVNKVFS